MIREFVANDREAGIAGREGRGHEKHRRRDLVEHRELALDDRHAADGQRRFADAAQARCASAGEDGRRQRRAVAGVTPGACVMTVLTVSEPSALPLAGPAAT